MKIRQTAVILGAVAVLLSCSWVQAEYHPTVPSESDLAQWMKAMNVSEAWNLGYTGDGVIVGVIDDSMSTKHADYKTSVLKDYCRWAANGQLTSDHASDATESQYHGTCVASCIGGYNIANQIVGTAYNASLIGIGSDLGFSSVDAAWTYLTSESAAPGLDGKHISVVNNSYGVAQGFVSNTYIDSALSTIHNADTTIAVYAAGNERVNVINQWNRQDSNKKQFQSSTDTITIAALNEACDGYADFSCYGACVLATAPGTNIHTSYVGDLTGSMYATVSGTSFSSPYATGVIALAVEAAQKANGVTLDLATVKQLIAETCTKVDTDATSDEAKWTTNMAGYSFSNSYGFGIINAGELVKAALNVKEITESAKVTYKDGQFIEGEITPVYHTATTYSYYDAERYLVDSNGSFKYYWDNDQQKYVPFSTSSVSSASTNSVSTNSANVSADAMEVPNDGVYLDNIQPILDASALEIVQSNAQVCNIDMNGLSVASEVTTLANPNSLSTLDTGSAHGGTLAGYSYQIIEESAFTEAGYTIQPLQDISLDIAFQAYCTGDVRIELVHTMDTNNDGLYDASDLSTTSVLCFEGENLADATGARVTFTGYQVLESQLYYVYTRTVESAAGDNYIEWTFSSNAFWGESPVGKWEVFFYDMYENGDAYGNGTNARLYNPNAQVTATSLSLLGEDGMSLVTNDITPTVDISIPITFSIKAPLQSSVPEPSTWLLMGLSLLGLGYLRRRQMKK